MAATTSSSSCSGLFSLRSTNAVESRVRDTSPLSQGSPSCGKLDGVAAWFINGVTTVFFSSLERCSCIRIATDEEDGEDANDLPLILNDGNLRHHDGGGTTTTTTSRRRMVKGKKSSAALVDQE